MFNLKRLDLDLYDVDARKYDNKKELLKVANKIVKLINTSVVTHKYHKFKPYGSTLILILADSSMAIHTYPEKNFITIEIHTCGIRCNPLNVIEYVENNFTLNYKKNYTENLI
jgi:S-adenosylmethionine decarboxylase